MSYHNDPYRVDYLKIYPCLKENSAGKMPRMVRRVMFPVKRIRWSDSYILQSASLRTMLKASRMP